MLFLTAPTATTAATTPTAAIIHSLPLPCVVKVTNLENGKKLKMRLNDRGPFIPGRIIDVTPRAAAKLGFKDDGLADVQVDVVSVGDGSYKRKVKKSWFPWW